MKSDQVLDRYNYCGPASKCIVSLQARPVTMLHQMTMSRGNFTNTRHATTYDHVSPLKLDLAGKHVLITGTAFEDGVGCATAMAFARAGATAIAIADLRGVSEEVASKIKARAVQAGRIAPKVVCHKVDIARLDDIKAISCACQSKRLAMECDIAANEICSS
jgi:tRNA A37 threonylcarbamoyladenosine dehydratase